MLLTLLYVVFAYLAEQNSKLVDLKLKKTLETQPQVANSLSSAAQKAVTDSSEQDVKVSFDSRFCLSTCVFWSLFVPRDGENDFLPNPSWQEMQGIFVAWHLRRLQCAGALFFCWLSNPFCWLGLMGVRPFHLFLHLDACNRHNSGRQKHHLQAGSAGAATWIRSAARAAPCVQCSAAGLREQPWAQRFASLHSQALSFPLH